jgi:hypothetical protein
MATEAQNLRFLTWEERPNRPMASEYRVMLFTPKGRYPGGTWHLPNGFFHADEEITFSVVYGESWEMLDPDMPFSEFRWASPQELRLIASLLLCEVMDFGYMTFYPIVRFDLLLDADDLDLQSPEIVAATRSLLLHEAAQDPDLRNEFRGLTTLRRPRTKYELIDPRNFALDRRHEFWQALEKPNYVLLRGVYALMKSDMLCCHYEFSEEAVVSLYIALDASLSLVLRQLEREGRSNPTTHDAAVWVHDHFNANFGHAPPDLADRYFAEFYEQRVMTLHPASRFGDVPYSPTMHDDICFLRPWLRQIFAYLLTGEHDPGYLEALREHQRRCGPLD